MCASCKQSLRTVSLTPNTNSIGNATSESKLSRRRCWRLDLELTWNRSLIADGRRRHRPPCIKGKLGKGQRQLCGGARTEKGGPQLAFATTRKLLLSLF